MNTKKTAYLILSIDTECDKSINWSIPYPLSFTNISDGVKRRLQPLLENYDIRPTYLLSPEVINNKASAEYFAELESRCELGTHLHGEFVVPNLQEKPQWTNDFQADYEAEVEYQKLKNLTELFRSVFGYNPKSFRAGRFGLGSNTWRFLSDLGYKADSSLFPYNIIKTEKYVHNFYNASVKPFYPDLKDWKSARKEKTSQLLHVPMTVHNWLFQRLPSNIALKFSDQYVSRIILRKIFGRNREKTFSLRPGSTSSGIDIIRMVIDNHAKIHLADEPIVFNMMFHSNELIAGGSPYAQNEDDINQILNQIRWAIEYVYENFDSKSIVMSETNFIYRKTE